MIESIKQKALGITAANNLEFAPQFHGKWYEGYKLLLECYQNGQEPEHCSFRQGVDFWNWGEAIDAIEIEAEYIWKPFADELTKMKASLLENALEDRGANGLVTANSLKKLKAEDKHAVLVKSLKLAVHHLNNELDTFRVSSYSGRGMFGRECVSVNAAAGMDITQVALVMGDLYRELGEMRQDSLGLGSVFYWPAIEYQGTEEEDAA